MYGKEWLTKVIDRYRLQEIFLKKEAAVAVLVGLALLGAAIFSGEFRSWFGASRQSAGANLPRYTGRPVREYREKPEEVRLFTQAQRDILKQKLNDQAGSIDINPDQLDPWLQAGLIKKTIGDYEGARDAWEYASLIRPKNFVSFKNLGELYWHYLPDYPRAEINFRKAIANEPYYIDSYISLSEVYRYSWAEKADLADDVLLEGLEKNPQSKDLTIYLARFYKERGSPAKAVEYYKKFLALDPGNTEIAEEIRKLQAR